MVSFKLEKDDEGNRKKANNILKIAERYVPLDSLGRESSDNV